MLNQAQPYPSHDPPGATDDDDGLVLGGDEPELASPGCTRTRHARPGPAISLT